MNSVSKYSSHPIHLVKEMPSDEGYCSNLPNIDMDRYLVVVGKTAKIGTNALSACFAVTLRGQKADGEPVFGLWHKSPYADGRFYEGFKALKMKMEQAGCLPQSIETCIIGGNPRHWDRIFNEEISSLDEEAAMMKYASKARIRHVLFNYSKNDEDPLSLVMTSRAIYVSKEELFQPSSVYEFAGEPLLIDYDTDED